MSASFSYDYLSRRRSKTMGSALTQFVLDGDEIVTELSGGSTIPTLQSPFADQPIQRNGLYLTPDHLGSTTTLTDGSGNVAEAYFYLPFGQTWQSAVTASPIQFAGRENDGTGLYYNRARYYSPDWGRFLSEDPGAVDLGDANLYAYAGNDPIDLADPLGLDWLDTAADYSAGVGDSLTLGGTYLFRVVIGQNEAVHQNSAAYQAGGYSELAAEIALTGGAAALQGAAGRVSASAVRYAAGREFGAELRASARAGGFDIHHINPLFGHPGSGRTIFPLGGLPAWIHSGRWNRALLTAERQLVVHARLRFWERVVTRVVNYFTTGARAARLYNLRSVTVTNPSGTPSPTVP